MSEYFFPLTWNDQTKKLDSKEFNSSDFNYNYGSITKGDLLKYANKTSINIFQQINYFTDLFANSINGVNKDIFAFLINITEDVQGFITYSKKILTNIEYIEEDDITSIKSNLLTERITCNNNINSSKLISLSLVSQNVITNNLKTKNITCDVLHITKPDKIGVFIYSDNMTYPLKKSNLVSNILSTNILNLTMSIDSGYTLRIYNINKYCIYEYKNDTDDFKYNIPIICNDSYKFVLYYKSIEMK